MEKKVKLISTRNIWTSTTLISGSYDADESVWNLHILRDGAEQHLRTSYVVFAVGAGCNFPISPTYENKARNARLI